MGNPLTHFNQSLAQYIGATVKLAVDGGVHVTDGFLGNPAPLATAARYALLCPEAPVLVRQGGAGLGIVGSDSYYLHQGEFLVINTDDLTNNRIAVTAATGIGGFLRITRIDSLSGLATGTPGQHQTQFYQQFIGPTIPVAIGLASVESAGLIRGARYALITPDDDVYIRQGADPLVVSSAEMFLPRGTLFYITVDDSTGDRIAVISATGSAGGTLRATRVDAV